ncbi:multinuclear nonheme iron-dependent oxidase [Fibrivirga algicola]|uniref:DUF692 domain-containing protein n=1 Tax=Fibrivirga algicola TaxID=2950420 RepID=A0ABX0QMB2_9BACT|nr:DUF692 family multinuclear iron-containing protein [Fibrivirga algicola]NID11279.1 DUF692 domain-containing protein [Fibrivirga algicola]
MAAIRSTLACNLETNLILAALPLFEAERVAALEWSFDALYAHEQLPDWFTELLTTYSEADRLVGHGVFFSLLSGRWTSEQQAWLIRLRALSREFRFDHITEHFGFMTGADFHKGAPINVPCTAVTLALGQDRLSRIQDACRCPVGLENLAFAYSLDDVKRQGDFLRQLIEPVNGFIILDLHNLYCQSKNFNLDLTALLDLYPLDRVREIHISGGSWAEVEIEPGRHIRRDTHDDAVPDDIFNWLSTAIDRCPNLGYVVLEQLGAGLTTGSERLAFQADFDRMDVIVQQKNKSIAHPDMQSFLPELPLLINPVPLENHRLYTHQLELSAILETAVDVQQAKRRLAESSLANSEWEVERWEPAMLETAVAIARKWKNGFVGKE